tara:strand:- start:707 stop:1558 length:852 start_codon:yes stop_codon:yes gene_type:complete
MKVGLALGGGGVRGLAHVLALEVLDDCGVKPDVIAGTSMGAIVGAMYASGYSGKEIREGLRGHVIFKEDKPKDVWKKKRNLSRWLRFFRITKGKQGMFSADGFLSYLVESLGVETFEQLKIPFRAVATDFYRKEVVILKSGDLLPAIKASMAIPGVFEPVVHEGRVLVDGGLADNLPYGTLMDECDVVIAIDVVPTVAEDQTDPPSMMNAVLGMFDSLIEEATRVRLEEQPPTLYVRVESTGVRMLDFDEIEEVYAQAEPAIEKFKEDLKRLLESESKRPPVD